MVQTYTVPNNMTHHQVMIAFFGLLLVMLLSSLDSTIVSTALPTIVGEMDGLDHLSWVVTSYLLTMTVATPIYGKIGDLYGRKRAIQSAIIIFLVASAFCGMSHSIGELIFFRALQGIGGGGLLVGAQASIGELFSPRERAKYQGLFGAVYGISNGCGPFIGGFFVDNLSWRWIFYINLPLGIIALLLIGFTLNLRKLERNMTIDYAGTAFLTIGLSSLVLFCSLGGSTYTWSSLPIISLGIITFLSFILLIAVERKAKNPVLPLHLFRNRTFIATISIAFGVGFVLLGVITFLPLYLQIVKGVDPADSGIQLLPLIVGVLVASILSGQLINKFGHYKIYPIIGMTLTTIGLWLFIHLNENTSHLYIVFYLAILGCGLGMMMQTVVLIVQNAVNFDDLGSATSNVSLFRSIGGLLGTALLGTLFSQHLDTSLAKQSSLIGSATVSSQMTPVEVLNLPPKVRQHYINAYAEAIDIIFPASIPITLFGLVMAFSLKEIPLRKTAFCGMAEYHPMPKYSSSIQEIETALLRLVSRDYRHLLYERIAANPDIPLPPLSCWILARAGEWEVVDVNRLATKFKGNKWLIADRLSELEKSGLINNTEATTPSEDDVKYTLTATGQEMLEKILEARRSQLAEFLSEWAPEKHEELATMLKALSRVLDADAPSKFFAESTSAKSKSAKNIHF